MKTNNGVEVGSDNGTTKEVIELIDKAIDWTQKQCVGGILEVEGAKHKVGSRFLYRQEVENKLDELKQAIDQLRNKEE